MRGLRTLHLDSSRGIWVLYNLGDPAQREAFQKVRAGSRENSRLNPLDSERVVLEILPGGAQRLLP